MDKSLNKYISETGFCSRREADKYIEQGRVTINDNIASKGNRVMPGDVVEIDGESLKKKDKTVYIAFNKPVGITCTTDMKDKTNIISFINYKSRIFPIGRLDKPSEGLIFLTNDGDIVNKILRAGNNHEKEYIITTDKPITGDFVTKMSNGVKILGTVTKKCFVKQEGKNRFRIILVQGLNRQIRRMCEALGYKVITLKRVRIMNITIANLPQGKWRYFTSEEIASIEKMISNSSKTEEASNISFEMGE
ncbi:23S rRNA pseudouridine(2604) synthase RluF [Ferruginibacter lapsinanis]|uniref:23S rRNA pseudouridine(2604) synthase RluF n=1 Tax=Ferruginibacter lapsinanis TaxID=563172 RepID=UPI001E42CFB9|nr:23S rRNA pseudouridine(2604) synthase RluF [Ferruginibacter lapsinanis]UEG49271.1 23S rRNA pseudouridine(2604) synthase RluF [Ferruginibacter lapsinanis]